MKTALCLCVCACFAGDGTWGLMRAKQALYQEATTPA